MKILSLLFILNCFNSLSFSQSPSFSVKFRLEEIMYDDDTFNSKYTVILERSRYNEADINYRQDTSKIDWKNLPYEISKDLNSKIIYKVENNSFVTDFYYHNQDYAFEYLVSIRIFREKCNKYDTMDLKFPIIISSFVTMVNFGTLYFYPGMYDLTDNMIYTKDVNNYLQIKPKVNILPK
ncbi:MAG: hypothetical protein WC358_10270 [Ignavibacteria bacterium]|jgi:hypothetical protein